MTQLVSLPCRVAIAAFTLFALAAIPFVQANAQQAPVTDGAVAGMKQAAQYYVHQVALRGGYVYHYTLDLKTRWGEGLAGRNVNLGAAARHADGRARTPQRRTMPLGIPSTLMPLVVPLRRSPTGNCSQAAGQTLLIFREWTRIIHIKAGRGVVTGIRHSTTVKLKQPCVSSCTRTSFEFRTSQDSRIRAGSDPFAARRTIPQWRISPGMDQAGRVAADRSANYPDHDWPGKAASKSIGTCTR